LAASLEEKSQPSIRNTLFLAMGQPLTLRSVRLRPRGPGALARGLRGCRLGWKLPLTV
jgi:hypothetical protein